MPAMTIQAVIFDFFGTLVDDFVASTAQMTPDLATAVNAPHEQFMELWRKTSNLRIDGTFQSIEAAIEYVCTGIGIQPTPEKLTKAVEIRLNQIRQALKPRPDAIQGLQNRPAEQLLVRDSNSMAGLSFCRIGRFGGFFQPRASQKTGPTYFSARVRAPRRNSPAMYLCR